MNNISVIIPLYNKAKYIRRALDSVLAQTFRDIEIIVVDDGSSDEGPAIVKSYHDNRIKIIRQRNAGPGVARNRGLTESTGSLVAFLDADDEWMPEFLEKCFTALKNNPDCDVAAAAYYLGKNRKDISAEFRRREMTDGPWQLYKEINDNELKHAIYILHSSSTLSKKSTIEKYGGFYTTDNCRLGEDYYLWLQVMFNHKIFRILKPLWWYHLEASELGNESMQSKCEQPFLTDMERIKNNCPKDLYPLLEKWLTLYSLRLAHEFSYIGESRQAENLINKFPQMKNFHWEYFKLRTKMLVPQFIPVVRFIKHYSKQICQ